MMGPQQVGQAALFYEFSLERHVPAGHLLRSIDRFVDLSEVRGHLAPFISAFIERIPPAAASMLRNGGRGQMPMMRPPQITSRLLVLIAQDSALPAALQCH